MIPSFPNFKRLDLQDKGDIQKITRKFQPHSDYNFSSLWSYNTEDDIEISKLHDNLVVKFRDYLTNEPFLSFLGNRQIVDTASSLLDYAKKNKLKTQLALISEESITSSPKLHKHFLIVEDRDNHDYILSLEEQTNLLGNKFHRHRKQIAKFHKVYPESIFEVLELKKAKVRKQLINLFLDWQEIKKESDKEIKHELVAFKRLLDSYGSLNLVAFGLYQKSKLISFLIVDTEYPGYAESHFYKTHSSYPGANRAMRRFSSKYLYDLGLKYLNIEQDMGKEGLRFAKIHWKPIRFLKKYTISEKPKTR